MAGSGPPENNRTEVVRVLLIGGIPARAGDGGPLLEGPDLEVVTAASGEEGLRRLREDGDFKLVLLDADLPGMEGFETAERIRAHPSSGKIPFLFLGSSVPDETRLGRGYDLGAVDYVFPPFLPRALEAKVRMFAGLRREERRAEEPDEGPRPGAQADAEAFGSEERFRLMVESIKDYAIFMIDTERRITSWNPGVQRLLGYAEAEFVGKDGSLIFTPQDIEAGAPEAELRTALERGTASDERWHVRKDGSWFWASGVVTVIRDRQGSIVALAKIMRDFTERREAREALEKSKGRYRWIVENTTETVWQFRLERPVSTALPAEEQIAAFFEMGYLAECNEAMARLYGYASASDMIGLRLGKILDPGSPENMDFLRAFIASGYRLMDAASVELGSAGERKYVLNNLVGELAGDSLLGAWGSSRDITGWKLAEEEVRESRDLLEVIFQGVDEAISAQDKDGKFIFANPAAARALGFATPADLLAVSMEEALAPYEFLDEEGGPIAISRLPVKRALETGTASRQVIRYRRRDTGVERWSIVKASPIPDKAGKPYLAVNFFQDITDIKLTETELRQSREQLSVILRHIADAIIVQDSGSGLVYVNEAAARILGFPTVEAVFELYRSQDLEAWRREVEVRDEVGRLVPPEKSPSRRAMGGEEVPPTLLKYRLNKKSAERWVIAQARPIRDESGRVKLAVTILQDVTELRKTEEQFRQSQKMEAIGRLAGGIAHDFNNLLTAINGYSELLLGMSEMDEVHREYLKEIRNAGERAASLTNQLLAYSRKQILSPRVIDPNEVITGMEALMRRLIGEDVRLETSLDPGVGRIRADRGQVEQIILNLVVNARDAMPQGGLLRIASSREQVDTDVDAVDTALRPGGYAVITVSDTGAGMDEEVMARLFEPFFTTKKLGQGTGLGLSTAYGIAKQSGGTIKVRSEKGKGSDFKIFFPLTEAAKEAPAAGESLRRRPALQGKETVLVVEDEEAVRKLVVSTLIGLGYDVLQASDGAEALELAAGHHGPIDLLLTDIVMTRMGGRELADRLRQARPGIRTIYMSGYTDDAVVRHGVVQDGEPYLQKPVSPAALAREIRRVLDAQTRAG